MSDLPGISCFCSTYGRPRALIENSIWCFLEQDYAGPKELVILNDFDGQRYFFEHPEVRIINLAERIKPLGRKFNVNVNYCRYPLLAVWEDDDVFLKHRLSYSYNNMRDGIFHSKDAFFERTPPEIEVASNFFHSQHLFTRTLFESVGGYDEDDRCTIDISIMDRFRRQVGDYSQPITRPEDYFYIYVWSGANSFHGSGMGVENERVSDSAADVVKLQVADGVVETGDIFLNPRPRYHFYDHLPTPSHLFRPDNPRILYGLKAGVTIDITSRVARMCATAAQAGRWVLPGDDVARAKLFGDPIPNVAKKIYVHLPGTADSADAIEISPSEKIEFSFLDGRLAPDLSKRNLEAVTSLKNEYYKSCDTASDINQHLPLLLGYAKQCSSIVECGVRYVCSSYAFALGLQGNPKSQYTLIDPFKSSNIQEFLGLCQRAGIDAQFVAESDLTCPLIETDLLFIDTWHVYAQLKRELMRWHSSVRKFIILHDTTIDAVTGESIRNGWNIDKQSQDFGFPADEIAKGLWPAVEEFLDSTPEWSLDLRLENNSGLTILRRQRLQEEGPMTPIPRTQG